MRFALLTLCFWLAACAGPEAARQAQQLAAQHRAGQLLGHASRHADVPDVATAYRIQRAFVRARYGQAAIAGYKGGLTAEPAWQRFGLEAPVVGVLAAEGVAPAVDGVYCVNAGDYASLMLETELAWRFSARIAAPVTDTATLQALVDGVAPAVELPDLGFADTPNLNGLDLIAANVSARGFIVGAWQSPGSVDVNAISVQLYRDGVQVNAGHATDALGDQWQALRMLVNLLVAQGQVIEPGQFILTGALGRMVAGGVGDYRALFGVLGEIRFGVVER